MKKSLVWISLLSLILLSGCDFKKVDEGENSLAGGMKCGAGKCGANMFDGNSALAKKKNNILSQMRVKDSRKDCVKNAKTTKDAYNCVREPNGNKLTMKCGSGKCGASMQEEKPKPKEEAVMKCGGDMKCGGSK